jgi:hypothetical protein
MIDTIWPATSQNVTAYMFAVTDNPALTCRRLRPIETHNHYENLSTLFKQYCPASEEMRTFIQKVPTAVIILIARRVTESGSGTAQETVIRSRAM